MVDVPVDPDVDKKNGVVDGRDFARKLIAHAYKLLGAYANGDETNYERLRGVTEYLAQMDLDMDDEQVPSLMIVLDDESEISATERWDAHIRDTEQKTQNLLGMSDKVSGRHRSG